MTDPVTIRVRDLRRYLDGYSDDAVVLRDIGDARIEGAYVDLNLAMDHLEQEHGADEDAGAPRGDAGDGDADDNNSDSSFGSEDDEEEEEEDDYEDRLEEERALARDQERSIGAWEKAQD